MPREFAQRRRAMVRSPRGAEARHKIWQHELHDDCRRYAERRSTTGGWAAIRSKCSKHGFQRYRLFTPPTQFTSLSPMQPKMTEVIAVRRLWWEQDSSRQLLESIGKPTQSPDTHGEFYCPIQTSGFGNDEHVETIFGVDAFQALELAMRYVGWRLFAIDRESGGHLRWEFGDDGRIPKEWEQKPVATDSSV